jgi:hypothetical protein
MLHVDKETKTMNYLPISGLPMIEEDEATEEVAQIYAEIKRDMQVPTH